jgi:hypothetical protein
MVTHLRLATISQLELGPIPRLYFSCQPDISSCRHLALPLLTHTLRNTALAPSSLSTTKRAFRYNAAHL